MLKDIIEKIKKNEQSLNEAGINRKIFCEPFDTYDWILSDLKKEAELQEEMAEALLDEVKHYYYNNEFCSEKSINIIEKYYNKKWEEIIK
jgi:hypothetical protein